MSLTSREITDINTDLPVVQLVEQVNKRLAQLEGMAKKYNFITNEVIKIRSGLGLDEYYTLQKKLGNSDADYTGWSVAFTDSGYDIWRINVPGYSYDDNNQVREDNKVVQFMGEAISSSDTQYSAAWVQSGGTWTDITDEAGSDTGTPFTLLGKTSEELFVGSSAVFSGMDFGFYKPGSGYSLQYNYSIPSGWGSGATSVDILKEDGTNNWRRDGLIRFNVPGDWSQTNVNGDTLYWLRLYTNAAPTQKAEAYFIKPDTNPKNLLSLSSDQFKVQGLRRWCSYNDDIYLTIRNDGDSLYEGNLFIRSGSDTTTRKQYFVTNHTYEIDHKNSSYIVKMPQRMLMTWADPGSTSLSGRYMNVSDAVQGERGHTVIRDGYITGIGMSAEVAPATAALTFVARKNRLGTVASGSLAVAATSNYARTFTPVAVSAGDTVQVFSETSGATGYNDVVVDLEITHTNLG